MVLSGLFAGERARIVPPPYPEDVRAGDILIELEEGERGRQFLFNPRAEIAQRLPGPGRPKWFPPISIRDGADLHEAILGFSLQHDWGQTEEVDWRKLYQLVSRVWRARLPLEAEEIGVLLEHHGVPVEYQQEVVNVFRHCRDVLVFAVGRKPIKKKRTDYLRRRRGAGGPAR